METHDKPVSFDPTWFQIKGDVFTLILYIQPNAKQTQIAGVYHGALKIKLATLPIEGRANAALLKHLAKLFEVPLSQITFIRGEKSRFKKVEIRGSKVDPCAIR